MSQGAALKQRVLKKGYTDIHQKLVESCKRGDRKAQYEIYKLYSKAMFNICMRITNDYAEAEDVLQEAFVDAFRKLDTFKGDATFGAWLKRIVINKSINHVKKRKADFVSVDNMDFGEEPPQKLSGEDEELKLQVKQVHRAIQQLPDGFRVVLTLYLLEGYDHREISEVLGITESTSKSQYNRAKKRLLSIIRENVLI
ncbi:RNA polymerase [marine bacterium AO1-C]|nr:RNA polymerase [marine bacterium AO1-C]